MSAARCAQPERLARFPILALLAANLLLVVDVSLGNKVCDKFRVFTVGLHSYKGALQFAKHDDAMFSHNLTTHSSVKSRKGWKDLSCFIPYCSLKLLIFDELVKQFTVRVIVCRMPARLFKGVSDFQETLEENRTATHRTTRTLKLRRALEPLDETRATKCVRARQTTRLVTQVEADGAFHGACKCTGECALQRSVKTKPTLRRRA